MVIDTSMEGLHEYYYSMKTPKIWFSIQIKFWLVLNCVSGEIEEQKAQLEEDLKHLTSRKTREADYSEDKNQGKL